MKIIKDSDICFLNEFWLNQAFDQGDYDLAGFKAHYFSRTYCKGGGLFLMYQTKLSEFINIEKVTADSLLWIRINTTLFDSDSDILLCCAYVPPYGSFFYRKSRLDIFHELLSVFKHWQNWIGDINSRIGSTEDYVQYDKLDRHIQDFIETCFTYPSEPDIERRVSMDSVINSFGRRFISVCQQSGLRILNGRSKSDAYGSITFQNRLGTSVIDYAAVHYSHMKCVSDFRVEDFKEFSCTRSYVLSHD